MPSVEQPTSPGPRLWTARKTCHHLGQISLVTLWRRMATDPSFPSPIKIARRNYFRPNEIDAYIARQSVAPPQKIVANMDKGFV